jgi:hypothetical protein
MMKCRGCLSPTYVNERGSHLPLGSSSSLGWILVVATMALGSMSMIHISPFCSDSDLEPTSDSEAFTSATNDYFERQSTVLCQGLLWKSHHFPVSFFVFPLSFFVLRLSLVFLRLSIFSLSFFYGLGLPLPCFCCEGFPNPNSHVVCLRFCSILMAYR